MVLESVKVALDPSLAQERLLLSHAGAARFAYNAGLAHVKACIEAGAKPEWSLYGLRRWWNSSKDTLAVSDDGVIWWHENSKEAYSSGLEALAKGLSNWSKSRWGDRKGRRVGFPQFKSKDRATPRFAYTTGSFGLIQGDPKALKLPRIGRVHCMENVTARVGDARVLRMTVSKRAGRWFASLTVERGDQEAQQAPKGGAVGIDLGIKTLATLSDGTVIKNPRVLAASERRLKRAQKALSRKTMGSRFGLDGEENGGIPVFVSLVFDVSVEVLAMAEAEGVDSCADAYRLTGHIIVFIEVAGLQAFLERSEHLVGDRCVLLKEASEVSEDLRLFHDDVPFCVSTWVVCCGNGTTVLWAHYPRDWLSGSQGVCAYLMPNGAP